MAGREFIYTDESGTHGNAAYCVVAGYRGTPGQWGKFESEWRGVLAANGVVGAFHADPFWNRKRWTRDEPNQFSRWDDAKAARLMSGLINVIRGRRIHAIGGGVPVQAFNALRYGERCLLVSYVPPHLIPERKLIKVKNPEPYMLAYSMTVIGALGDVSDSTELHFGIARHQQYGPRAEEHWWMLKEAFTVYGDAEAKKLRNITQCEPENEPAIQAADLLAYLWYRSMQVGGDKNLTPAERDAAKATRLKNNHLQWADASQLQKMLEVHGDALDEWRTLTPPPGVSA